MFGEAHCNFPQRLAGNLWQEFFHSYPMDERKGLGSTHEKFVKVSVSPSTIFCQIRLTPRSVQSPARFCVFALAMNFTLQIRGNLFR